MKIKRDGFETINFYLNSETWIPVPVETKISQVLEKKFEFRKVELEDGRVGYINKNFIGEERGNEQM